MLEMPPRSVVLPRVLLLGVLACAHVFGFQHVLAQAPPAYDELPPKDTLLDVEPSAQSSDLLGNYNASWYAMRRLNDGLGTPPDSAYMISPQEAMETFVLACREGQFATAAHTLNLNLIASNQQQELAPVLAQQLYYVLDQQIGVPWSSLPDRPDGASVSSAPGAGPYGEPRRSISIGTLSSGGREIDLRLQRVRVAEASPKWVWAMTTVEEIPGLYANYGPG